MLSSGQKIPLNTNVLDENGAPTSLRSLLGKYAVLYFYPKDDTPGCTVEACEFRDANKKIKDNGAAVIGVSKDDAKSHRKFTDKFQLNFPLWTDPNHELMDALGVWGEKNMMGKKYMGIVRTTFLIDPDGTIVRVWEKVKPEGHAEEVLRTLQESIAKRT